MHRRTKKILIGFGVFVGILIAIYGILLIRSTVKLRRAYADLETAGRPMKAAEVIPEPVPEALNAAMLYQRAVATLKEVPAPKKDMLDYLGKLSYGYLRDDLDANEVAEFETLIGREEVATSLSLLGQALERPECRFDRDYKAGELDSPFELHGLRRIAAIARAKVYRQAKNGDATQVWDVVRAQFKIADALASDPSMDTQFARTCLIRDCCYTIQELCAITPADAESYRKIQDVLRGFDGVEPWVRAVDAERLVRGEHLFSLSPDELYKAVQGDNSSSGTGSNELDTFFRFMFRVATFRPSLMAAHAAYLRAMLKAVELYESPYVPRKTGIRKEFDDAFEGRWLAHWVSHVNDYFKESHCDMVARLNMTRAGLGVLEYRREHGTFPKSLDDLKLDKLTDPFVEQPLHYRVEKDGFLIYSVGEDMHDNDGAVRQRKRSDDPRRKIPEYDLLWRFSDTQGSTTEDV
jgi:hypothetical protein